MKHFILFAISLMFAGSAMAASGELFLDPHIAVGFNPAQGTNYMFGLSGGIRLDESLSAGLGAYYSMGERPAHDREIGIGPFVSYTYPISSFLIGGLRQEIDYMDIHDPIESAPDASGRVTYTHTAETGVASITSASLTLFFTPNFAISGGYRFMLALSNDDLDEGRSGAFVGLAIGI